MTCCAGCGGSSVALQGYYGFGVDPTPGDHFEPFFTPAGELTAFWQGVSFEQIRWLLINDVFTQQLGDVGRNVPDLLFAYRRNPRDACIVYRMPPEQAIQQISPDLPIITPELRSAGVTVPVTIPEAPSDVPEYCTLAPTSAVPLPISNLHVVTVTPNMTADGKFYVGTNTVELAWSNGNPNVPVYVFLKYPTYFARLADLPNGATGIVLHDLPEADLTILVATSQSPTGLEATVTVPKSGQVFAVPAPVPAPTGGPTYCAALGPPWGPVRAFDRDLCYDPGTNTYRNPDGSVFDPATAAPVPFPTMPGPSASGTTTVTPETPGQPGAPVIPVESPVTAPTIPPGGNGAAAGGGVPWLLIGGAALAVFVLSRRGRAS